MSVRSQARRRRSGYRGLPFVRPPHYELASPEMRWWYHRYTRLICDFLADELTDGELLWADDLFTPLHELVGHVYGVWSTEDDVVTDANAWSRFDSAEHLAFEIPHSFLPSGAEPVHYAWLFVRFLEYLVREGVVPPETGARLQSEYRAPHPHAA